MPTPPVLVGLDADSTYCYLLQSVDYRDEDTGGWHLLDVMWQGFESNLHDCRWWQWSVSWAKGSDVKRTLSRRCVPYPAAVGTSGQWVSSMTQRLTIQPVKAKRGESGLVIRARDIKILFCDRVLGSVSGLPTTGYLCLRRSPLHKELGKCSIVTTMTTDGGLSRRFLDAGCAEYFKDGNHD